MLFISHETEDKAIANDVLRRVLERGYGDTQVLLDSGLDPKDNLPWPPPGETENCPFPGLMCFDEKHAPVFFGREQERVPRLLLIVGGSGSEKSSLLCAGVPPWLK